MRRLWNEPIVRFLAVGFALYISWLAIYEWWIHPLHWVDELVINNTIVCSRMILGWLGYVTEIDGERLMRIPGTPGLFIGDSCNGIALFALFSIFIVAFPGQLISKIIFIPVRIAAIHFLNILRVVLLAIIETYSYSWTEFNHTYTFTILIYAFIFGMWLFWINKYSALKKSARIIK